LPETHAFLRELRAHIDRRFGDRMLLAEANQWPEDSVAYFGNGDECHMAFHFPVMPRMFMAIRMEDRFPIIDILSQTPAIPESSQWALFLHNHDELTLGMVTDEAQQANPNSLLWWMKRLVALRKRHPAFCRGSLEFLQPEIRKILAFVRRFGDETLLVVANLSRFVQYAELDLSEFEGYVPVELFGQVEFPAITRSAYFLTFGPNAFMWFALDRPAGQAGEATEREVPNLPAVAGLGELATGRAGLAFAEVLSQWAQNRRWFRGKARRV